VSLRAKRVEQPAQRRVRRWQVALAILGLGEPEPSKRRVRAAPLHSRRSVRGAGRRDHRDPAVRGVRLPVRGRGGGRGDRL